MNAFIDFSKKLPIELIQLFVSIVMAIFAIIAICQTYSIINQQRSEEFIRLRAYLYIGRMEGVVIKDRVLFYINIKNSGQTPAKDFTIKDFYINNIPIDTQKPYLNMIFGPGMQSNISLDYDERITPNKSIKYPYNFKYSYKNYNNTCSLVETKGIINLSNKPDEFASIESQNVEDIKCN